MDAYLWKHVLKPRFPRCVDEEHGGFHMSYARDWSPQEDRGRFVVYEARALWTAATVARRRPEARDEYLRYVRHGVRYLADVLWDEGHGGFHTFVDLAGKEAGRGFFPSRPVYGQAFAVYGLAAAHAATKDPEPLGLAQRGWRWIEGHYRDGLGPGYASGVKPDGRPVPLPEDEGTDAVTSIEGPAHHRTMNDHIHLLEAYAELLRSWPDPELRRRTEELLAFVRDTIFVEPGCLYIALWPNGKVVPAPVSFGHDVETAFLMIEAEEALGRRPSAATLRAARMLVDHALARGYDPARGQLFELGRAYGPPADRSVEWWGQFEALHAFQLMDEIFGREDDRYRTAFGKAWTLARDAFADPQHPGVCPTMDATGAAHCSAKSHMWFASYHTARALLFTADRLRER
ncbi:MAG TPA: AGE family epimerase/isomerase [Vicinamibacteria bacterium]|nr:AGE family epimerase/isomerase [Vicinamibacteria bacterium]